MTFADKSFPSSKAFDLIDQVLQDKETRNEMMKSANAVFAFDLTSSDGNIQVFMEGLYWLTSEKKSWYIDLKEEGKVGTGDKLADVRLAMKDEIFQQLVEGTANAQSLFMQGKFKVKGNIMLSLKLERVLKRIQNKAKL